MKTMCSLKRLKLSIVNKKSTILPAGRGEPHVTQEPRQPPNSAAKGRYWSRDVCLLGVFLCFFTCLMMESQMITVMGASGEWGLRSRSDGCREVSRHQGASNISTGIAGCRLSSGGDVLPGLPRYFPG